MNENIKTELEELFKTLDVKTVFNKFKKVFEPLEDFISPSKETKVENVKKMLEGKTIAKAEFESYSAQNDTLILKFTDDTHLKIVSDPKNIFDGLAFFQIKTRTVEQQYDEEIK